MEKGVEHPLPVLVTILAEALRKLRQIGSNDMAAVSEMFLWRGMTNLKPSDEFKNAGRDGAGTHVDDDRHQDRCRVLAQQRELDLHDRHQKRRAEGRKSLVVVCLSYRGRDLFSTLDISSAHRQETSCGDQRYAVHYCRGGAFELRE